MMTTYPDRRLHSLRSRILLLALLVCVLLASALTGFFLFLRQTRSTMIADSTTHLFTILNTFARDYLSATASPSGAAAAQALDEPPNPDAEDTLRSYTIGAFRRDPGVEGGFYSSSTDSLVGYAFPTNDGPGPKQDVPPRERPTILATAQQAATTGKPASSIFRGQKDVILFQAIPLARGGHTIGSVWGMRRIHDVDSGRDLQALLGLSCLALAAMACVGVAFWITRNVQSDVQTIQGRLQDLEVDLKQPRRGDASAAEMDGILRGIDRLGISLQQKIAKERQLIDQLHHKERLAALGQVAAGVAHELRNPLATIRLRTQMSLRSKDSEQLDRSAKLILEEIDRLSAVLERLLYFAKPIQLQVTTFDPAQMCEDVIAALGPEAESAAVALTLDSASHGEISGDALKLRQVIENLIRNAMESFDGMSVRRREVRVAIAFTPESVQITIVDNGSGLPDGSSAKVFDPFFTTKARGTGLGLSIANEIVRAHQGTLELKRAADSTAHHPDADSRGTAAELTLPRHPDVLESATQHREGVNA